jgi:hypothetical protein
VRDLGFAVDELGAELDRHRDAGLAHRPAAAADALTRFEEQHRATRAAELGGGRKAGGARAYDDDVASRKAIPA